MREYRLQLHFYGFVAVRLFVVPLVNKLFNWSPFFASGALQLSLVSDTLSNTDSTIYKWNGALDLGEGDSFSILFCFIGTVKFNYFTYFLVCYWSRQNYSYGELYFLYQFCSLFGGIAHLSRSLPGFLSRLIVWRRSPFCLLVLCQDPDWGISNKLLSLMVICMRLAETFLVFISWCLKLKYLPIR